MNRRNFVAALLAIPAMVRGLLKPASAEAPIAPTPTAAKADRRYAMSYAHPVGAEYDDTTFVAWTPPSKKSA